VSGPSARAALINIVTPRYFETLHIALISGRLFNVNDRLSDAQIDDFDAERGAGVAIVDEAFAKANWPGKEPVGQYLAVSRALYRSIEVIGVVKSVRSIPGENAKPTVYLPYAQTPMSDFRLLVSTSHNPAAAAAPLRALLAEWGTDVMAFDVKPMDALLGAALAKPRFSSVIMGTLGASAIVLTAAGLFTLFTFLTAQRRREFAIRVSVGATHSHITRIVLRQSLRLASLGTASGVLIAIVISRLLSHTLPELAVPEPTAIIALAVLALSVSMLASYFPARRAARCDPMIALRAD
jgi:ABC-type antimicrobial peptide transport system permease subunit